MSATEIPEESMSRMAEENQSEAMMAQVSVLQQLVDRIFSPPISELLGELKLDEMLLNTLKTNLQNLDAILDDAESKDEDDDEHVQRWRYDDRLPYLDYDDLFKTYAMKNPYGQWLDDLNEVRYDVEDLLDEIATERLRHQFESKPWNIETYLEKIRDPFEKISSRITRLLQSGKETLGLSEASRILREPYPLSAAKVHLEDESQVYGMDEHKRAIIDILLSDNETDDPVTVIPIVGRSGVGKTTLARLVYNDYRVSKQFDLKGWAYLSPDLPFDEGLIKAFSEAFSIVDSENIKVELRKILKMKKFLLVLDDVPYSWHWDWEKVADCLSDGANGSTILLTARHSMSIDKNMHFEKDHKLMPLNSDSSWTLFIKHAFADKGTGLHPELEAIGKNIVAKCDGMPLLIVTLGAMLRLKPSVEEWQAVLRILETRTDIFSILWMSYGSLPPNLKRCFAYCSIFPRDHEYDKEKLVLLWMAEGFLQHSKDRRIEEVGHEYFDDLISRSFFQKSGANSSRFVMHSLWHNLAQSVSANFCFRFDNARSSLPPGRVRHLSFSRGSFQKLIYFKASQLRTLLPYYLPAGERSKNLSAQFLGYLQRLRVLSFSHLTITELPDSIGALKLLQYLDLSHTKITRLPNTVTALYNLQTLLLSHCHLLSKLPKKFRRLVYLRHLDIRETCLKEMPAKMGCLTSLQSLSDFVVGEYSGSNIRELGRLKNLQGTLRISQLQNVASARDASVASLKNKADLKVLELKWSDATANSQLATNVLEKLEPHQNLEKLSIISYNGIRFPGWVGDSSFSKMVFLHLSDSNSYSQLPPLGQLPSLKELIIERMRGLKKIGPEFFGVNNVSAKPFPSLEILVFREMPEWEGLNASEMQPPVFPRLKLMCIKNCPKFNNSHLSLCLPRSASVKISTDETVTVEKQLHEGHKVQVRGKEKLAEENLSEEKMAQASILQQLHGRISSAYISEFFGELKLDAGLLDNLNSNLLRLDALIDDAESKAYEDKLKEWFGDLQEVSYDLEDLLDEIASKRVHYQLESKPLIIKTRIQRIISPIIGDRLEEINSRITRLLQRGKDVLHLREASHILREPYPLAAKDHIDHECQVCGRDEDKEAIIKLLLSDHVSDNKITVLPVVGKNGIGKTTLAQAVYNDYRVSKQFDLKGWAYLSPNLLFDEGLINAFSEAFSIVDSENIKVELRKILKMKKFLLVLDDVPYSWHWDWEKVADCLSDGANGSTILLTARHSMSIDKNMHFEKDHKLMPLNSDSRWTLFIKHAFADKGTGLHPELEAIGKKIVAKCDGMPLLIVTLGSMLRLKPSVEEWQAVLRILDTRTDIFSILRMSYGSLPPNLKRCFAYCSIFPRHHEYDKEKLVLLWTAEGFLQHSKDRRIEEVGREYFDDLISRSFFQKSGANSSHFVMHSLWHILAQSVSADFCYRFGDAFSSLSSGRVRHLSFSIESFQELIYCNASQLRTLLLYYLPRGKSPTHLSGLILERTKNWRCLRVLSLSHHTITEWPDSIGALKLLRYLDLSHTKITRLPNFVTTLFNLQTLLLSYCRSLSKLPKDFRKLVYLCHLDIRETCLIKEMPAKMGCLTSLQSLSDFVVGRCSGSNIRELGPLKNLGGTLCISQLHNVTSARDASEANLKDKADLKVLELKWSDATANSQHAANVLEKLEPHQNLEKLSIVSYNGISFPDWVGDSSFSRMVFFHLSDCNSCSHLPPLGQLPALKELIIEGMRGVKEIGPEFFGVKNVSANPFPSLEILVFQEMPEWEEWSAYEMHPVVFPRLKQVRIKSCPKYVNRLSLFLPPSVEVEISASEETSMLPTEQTLSELPFTIEKQLHEEDKVQVRGKEKLQNRPSTAGLLDVEELQLPDSIVSQRTDVSITSNRPSVGSLQRLIGDEKREILSTTARLPEVEELQLPDSNVVQRFDVSSDTDRGKDSQEDIPSPEQESMNVSQFSQLKSLPPKLCSLEIEACDALEFPPTDLNMLNNLQDLYIINCHLLKSIRASHLPKALKTLHIRKCKEVEFLPTAGKHNSLENLCIESSCDSVKSFPLALENLCIESSCDSLESFPLAIFPRLRSLSILNCAKFNFLSITKDHMFLDALEIRDCTQFISFPEKELGIPNLTSILLSSCKNLKVLPGQVHGLTSLQSLFINECPEVELVPKGGLPSSLNLVCISFCHKLTPCIDWGLCKLEHCSRIEIEDGSKDLESFPEQNLLPQNLISLQISRLPNLKILDCKGLKQLTSLKTLEINSCNKLHSLPDEGLPSSLSYLYISDCPLLKSKLRKRSGNEWLKIAHIPDIQIDGKVIS